MKGLKRDDADRPSGLDGDYGAVAELADRLEAVLKPSWNPEEA